MNVKERLKRYLKFSKGTITLFIARVSLQLYYPSIALPTRYSDSKEWQNKGIGIYLQTGFAIRLENNYLWGWAVFVQLVGVGVGIAWDHCENPNNKRSDVLASRNKHV